jgi:hypothetical protein
VALFASAAFAQIASTIVINDDQLKINGARLPMFKFPRSPEGVTECGGKPCS